MRSIDGGRAWAEAPSAFIVRLEGEFDVAERQRLKDAFAIAAGAAVVVVDLERTDYIDSSVLECLVALHNATRQRGAELVLVALNSQVRRLFEVTELQKLFTIGGSVAEVTDVSRAEVQRLTVEARPLD
jgi:anti-sigma B factor antagonist